jgi:hypothetical protein
MARGNPDVEKQRRSPLMRKEYSLLVQDVITEARTDLEISRAGFPSSRAVIAVTGGGGELDKWSPGAIASMGLYANRGQSHITSCAQDGVALTQTAKRYDQGMVIGAINPNDNANMLMSGHITSVINGGYGMQSIGALPINYTAMLLSDGVASSDLREVTLPAIGTLLDINIGFRPRALVIISADMEQISQGKADGMFHSVCLSGEVAGNSSLNTYDPDSLDYFYQRGATVSITDNETVSSSRCTFEQDNALLGGYSGGSTSILDIQSTDSGYRIERIQGTGDIKVSVLALKPAPGYQFVTGYFAAPVATAGQIKTSNPEKYEVTLKTRGGAPLWAIFACNGATSDTKTTSTVTRMCTGFYSADGQQGCHTAVVGNAQGLQRGWNRTDTKVPVLLSKVNSDTGEPETALSAYVNAADSQNNMLRVRFNESDTAYRVSYLMLALEAKKLPEGQAPRVRSIELGTVVDAINDIDPVADYEFGGRRRFFQD